MGCHCQYPLTVSFPYLYNAVMLTKQERENAAIARLADRYAMRFVTMFQAGLSQAEIARQLGLTRQRVSQILKRARERGLIENSERNA